MPGRAGPGVRSLIGLAVLSGLFLALPVAVLVVRAVLDGSLSRALGAKVVLDALLLSLATTAFSLVITVAFGLPLAIVLARRRFRGSGLVEAIIDLPIVLPPSVAGLALLLVLGRKGFLGEPLAAFGLEIPFTTLAVILAQTFVSAPFFVRSARTGIARRRPRPRGRGACRRRHGIPAVPADHGPAGRLRARGRPGHELGAVAGRVRRHDHVRRQHRGPDGDPAARRVR